MKDNLIVSKLADVNDWVLGITVDNDRNIYYTTGKGLWKLNTSEDPTPQNIVSQDAVFAFLMGLVWDGSNKLFICDGRSNRILQYSLDTKSLSTFAGTGELGDRDGDITSATFCNPWGIALDKKGDLLITDRNHIRRICISKGTVQTIAGCTTGSYNGGHKDGNVNVSQFDGPHGMAVDNDGTIYVSDNSNFCIRKIKSGKVSTIAGTPGRSQFKDGTLKQSLFNSPGTLLLDEEENSLIVADIDALRRIDMEAIVVTSLSTLPGGKKDCLTSDSKGNMYLRVWTRLGQEPTGEILILQKSWSMERFLWLGNLKEDASYCLLATLPTDIIREIISQLTKNCVPRNQHNPDQKKDRKPKKKFKS